VNAHAVFLGLGVFKWHRLAANTTKQVSDQSSAYHTPVFWRGSCSLGRAYCARR